MASKDEQDLAPDAEQRRDETIRNLFKMPPRKHKEQPKRSPSQQKK
jgi:hypothetical protein